MLAALERPLCVCVLSLAATATGFLASRLKMPPPFPTAVLIPVSSGPSTFRPAVPGRVRFGA